jgi:hypothetical protein
VKQQIESHQFSDTNGNPEGGQTFAPGLSIAWQRGPLGRGEDRQAPNGCFVETVIEAAIDRLEFYQRSKFACEENALALEHLRRAAIALHERTRKRESRNVEGTHQQ